MTDSLKRDPLGPVLVEALAHNIDRKILKMLLGTAGERLSDEDFSVETVDKSESEGAGSAAGCLGRSPPQAEGQAPLG